MSHDPAVLAAAAQRFDWGDYGLDNLSYDLPADAEVWRDLGKHLAKAIDESAPAGPAAPPALTRTEVAQLAGELAELAVEFTPVDETVAGRLIDIATALRQAVAP